MAYFLKKSLYSWKQYHSLPLSTKVLHGLINSHRVSLQPPDTIRVLQLSVPRSGQLRTKICLKRPKIAYAEMDIS